MKFKIEDFNFDNKALSEIHEYQYGTNWPVVYILNNENEAYVGETLDAERRTEQHLQNPDRQGLTKMHIITDDTFNKSVILDLESYLIQHMSSDELYRLQNGNGGINDHDYYSRKEYENSFPEIWEQLREKNLAKKSIEEIENSDLFKYSPYKALTSDQMDAIFGILHMISNKVEHPQDSINEKTAILVSGSAGTGKTVLAIYLMKLLSSARRESNESADDSEELDIFGPFLERIGPLNAALVIPQQSLRKTVQNVFKSVSGLDPDMILSPTDVPNDTYDLLIVDEAHRLRYRKALAQYPKFDECNRKLGLDRDTGTELDWILLQSKMQILFYDPLQSVKPSDIPPEMFEERVNRSEYGYCELTSQLRCLGGNDYIYYIKKILSDLPPTRIQTFQDYDLKLYDDVSAMIQDIKNLDKKFGLCRTVAGYAWKWASKNDKRKYDIEIGNFKARWNSKQTDWVNSENALNEIGCIHTVQGYDLNYAGVIFGNEIKYDNQSKKIIVDKSEYYDHMGKTSLRSYEVFRDYILHIYITLMTRGIRGTYVYVCDDALREYLSKFFPR